MNRFSFFQGAFGSIAVLFGILENSRPATEAADLHVPSEYPTIQAAVDASSSGDTIRIAPGAYYEQIIITTKTNLTLVGAPPDTPPMGGPAISTETVLYASTGMSETLQPSTSARAVLGVLRSDNITVRGLTFDGERLGDLYSPARLVGVFYVSSSGLVENCTIRGFRAETGGYSSRGYCAFNPARALVLEVAVINSTFQENEQSILVAGNDSNAPSLDRLQFSVEGNIISGPSSLSALGIAIGTGAAGEVRGNTIQDFAYGSENQPAGLAALDWGALNRQAVPLKPLHIEGNTFLNNEENLVCFLAHRARIVNNTFQGGGSHPPRWGAAVISGDDIMVENNNFSDFQTGVFLFANDFFFEGWPSMGIARNPVLRANWFKNVQTPIRSTPVHIVLEEFTQTSDFRPRFLSVQKQPGGPIQTSLRAWHDQSLTVEASTDLREWSPLEAREINLPLSSFEYPNAPSDPHRFYRLTTIE